MLAAHLAGVKPSKKPAAAPAGGAPSGGADKPAEASEFDNK